MSEQPLVLFDGWDASFSEYPELQAVIEDALLNAGDLSAVTPEIWDAFLDTYRFDQVFTRRSSSNGLLQILVANNAFAGKMKASQVPDPVTGQGTILMYVFYQGTFRDRFRERLVDFVENFDHRRETRTLSGTELLPKSRGES